MALIARKEVIEELYKQTYERILSLEAQESLINMRILSLTPAEEDLRPQKEAALQEAKTERKLHIKMLKQLKKMHETADKDGEVADEPEEGVIIKV